MIKGRTDKRGSLGIFVAVGLGLMAITRIAAAAPAVAGPTSSRMTHDSVSVVAIDRATRSVTLQNVDGATKVVQVPVNVTAFDTLKVGDHVEIDYTESMAVSILPPGSTPAMSEKVSGMKAHATGATGTRELTTSAEILSIDRVNNKVTIKGPKGDSRTVAVTDPAMQKRLASMKPGQVVQITYTEAMAAQIRPSPMAAPPSPSAPAPSPRPTP
jgi:hypothetical protein